MTVSRAPGKTRDDGARRVRVGVVRVGADVVNAIDLPAELGRDLVDVIEGLELFHELLRVAGAEDRRGHERPRVSVRERELKDGHSVVLGEEFVVFRGLEGRGARVSTLEAGPSEWVFW